MASHPRNSTVVDLNRTVVTNMLLPIANPLMTAALAALLLSVAAPASAQTASKVPPEVIDQAAAHGTALVLVGLSVPWQLESNLSPDEIRAQRISIAAIQRDLLFALEGRKYKVVRRYDQIPGLALEVGADALAELASSPIVTNVWLDRATAEPEYEAEAKVPWQLFKHAADHGSVLVLAGLRTPWQREELLSDNLRDLQRTAIHNAQGYVLAELSGTQFKVMRLYRSIPGIALRVGLDALRVLENSPAVTNVIPDRPPRSAR